MKLHNTLTRKLSTVKPLEGNTVRIYSCGPTVYDHAHIGNLSTYIYSDTVQRALKLSGFDVQRVMNYTDVDDKTIRRSRETYPELEPGEALRTLTDNYIDVFNIDMRRIGNLISDVHFVRATDPRTIWGMQNLITRLHEKGFAYIADDGVYFSIDAYRKSGKIYGQLSEISAESTSEARIQNDEYDKESAHDFALWKTQKGGEPAWDFTLDGHDLKGRPGWHVECSVMSRQELGQPFDIHTGAVDLIFPHHENEIAQSTALEDNPAMASIFVHSEHLLIDGRKMAKSAKNFFTLEDIIAKGYDPLAFRLKILQSHYRNQVNFTWESLEAAQNLLVNLRSWADLKHQKAASKPGTLADSYKQGFQKILGALEDDLDTPQAMSALASLASESETTGVDGDKIQALLNLVDRAFGLSLSERPDITHEQKNLIASREQARQQKDWSKADEIRGQLVAQNITLKDTDGGVVWARSS